MTRDEDEDLELERVRKLEDGRVWFSEKFVNMVGDEGDGYDD